MIRELGPGSGAVDVSNDGDETVMKVVVKEGNGTTKPTTRSHVVVDYVGTLVSGKQFDSSRSRNVKFDFHIDVSPVIAGKLSVPMDVGARSQRRAPLLLRIPHPLACTTTPPSPLPLISLPPCSDRME